MSPFVHRYRRLIGLDLGSSLVKFILMEKTGDDMAIQGAGLFCPSEREFETGDFSPDTVARIRRQFEESGLKGLPAASNVEDASLRIRRVDIPTLPPDEVIPAVRWNLRDCVDGHIDDHVVRATPLIPTPEGLSFLAYAVRRDVVERQSALVRSFGLQPVTIEPSAVSLLRLCDFGYGWNPERRYALVDFGTKVSAFTVMDNGVLLFSRPLSGICELSLLKLISRNLEIDMDETMSRLASYRRGDDRAPTAPEDRLHITLQHYFSQVLLEIERSIDAFCMMFQTDTLGPLYVTGGASHLPGLVDYLAQELGISLKILNPFSNLALPAQERRRLQTSAYLFGVSVGLGLLTRGGLS